MTEAAQLFVTTAGFFSPRWTTCFPDAELLNSLDEAIQRVRQLNGDVVVWVLTGLEQWQALIRAATDSGARVIAISRDQSLAELRESLSHGARGYVHALSSTHLLYQASQTVSAGALWLPESLIDQLLSAVSTTLPEMPSKPTASLDQLTTREQDVARAVTDGLSNKAIARQLNITERTVKDHLSKIFSKLNVNDRMQLMLKIRGQ
ncbi:response regulator transcription factor [Salicola sp. Rm-C-2C1-2]|uniref:response regulator transcription factor n=1 Tax=Salicola sp. Rm-C-2C1-2 TaxID=3141321 RepID=UPI0032E3A7DC